MSPLTVRVGEVVCIRDEFTDINMYACFAEMDDHIFVQRTFNVMERLTMGQDELLRRVFAPIELTLPHVVLLSAPRE